MGKVIGTLHGVNFEEDPDVPPGQIYFLNDKYVEFARIDARSRGQRVIDFFKKCYYKAMKKQLIVLAALVVVLVCSSVAIVYSNNRKTKNQANQTYATKALQTELRHEQTLLALHDATNTANMKNAGDQILSLQTQKTTLCTQIKAARLTQPLCQ